MRRPDAAGTTLQVIKPLVQKLTELEQRALRGEAIAVVDLGRVLANILAATEREAMEVLLRQAAHAQGTHMLCTCGAKAESKGFERTSFMARFGAVGLERRRMECQPCDRSWFPFDQAWAVPTGQYADDVREATERLACRMGSFDEAVEELRYLWAVAPDGSTAKRWVTEDGTRAAQVVRADAESHWSKYDEQVHAQGRGDLRAPARSEGFGVIEVDGVHVLTWKPGQETRRRKATDEAKAPCVAQSAMPSAAVSETGERGPAIIRRPAPCPRSLVRPWGLSGVHRGSLVARCAWGTDLPRRTRLRGEPRPGHLAGPALRRNPQRPRRVLAQAARRRHDTGGRNVVQFVTQAVHASLNHLPLPSLLPDSEADTPSRALALAA